MNSPICWPGGKRNLLKTLLPLLPAHTTYVEPFCGSAKTPSKYEVISDANGELISFFLVLKYRASELAERLHSAIAHPHWFKAMKLPGGGGHFHRRSAKWTAHSSFCI